ncbi:Tonsoku-like protein [Gryllus bimaculatus]|nr:Tonsoku-like protein [Gryllus bimaculatus]
MDIASVFRFEKSNEALSNLEKLLTCKKCNEFCKNPRRHSDCGYLLCSCYSAKTDSCPDCGQRYSQSNTTPAYQVNTIIEAAKTIKHLICQKPVEATENRVSDGETENKMVTFDKRCTEASVEAQGIKDYRVSSDDFKKPENKAIQNKNKEVTVGFSSVSRQGAKSAGKQSKTNLIKEVISNDSKSIRKCVELTQIPANIKAIMKRNSKGETKLHTACVKGDTKKVEEFLSAGADPCTKDNAGWTPLHEAVSKGFTEIVKLLLGAGALVNVPGYYNNTPLHDAALNNHLEAARLLIEYGANPLLQNIEGYTPQSDVTHIVVPSNKTCTPAVDILHGILRGKWIVDSTWLLSCLHCNALVDASEQELTGTARFQNSFAPKRSRENMEKMQPSIFNGCHFYFSGVDKITIGEIKFTKAHLSSLVLSGDGLVLTREPNPEAIPAHERTIPYHAKGSLSKCSHYIIYQHGRHEPQLKYNMTHVKSLPVTWLLDCIETFTLIEP